MDKRQKLEDNILEEQVYAKLWMLDRDKKIAREQREYDQNKTKVRETLNILTWQNDARGQVSKDEQAKKIKKWQSRSNNFEQERDFLQKQVLESKRQNKLLKLAIGRLQN